MILTMESLILMEFEDGKFKCDDSDDGKINSSVTPRNYHINFPTVSIGTMGQPSSPYRQIPFPYGRQKCPWGAVRPDFQIDRQIPFPYGRQKRPWATVLPLQHQ